MAYNKEYYEKNKEKLCKVRREWNKKHYKGLPKNNKKRIAALKAWETRREQIKTKIIIIKKKDMTKEQLNKYYKYHNIKNRINKKEQHLCLNCGLKIKPEICPRCGEIIKYKRRCDYCLKKISKKLRKIKE